jgi:hypothetical protein
MILISNQIVDLRGSRASSLHCMPKFTSLANNSRSYSKARVTVSKKIWEELTRLSERYNEWFLPNDNDS